MGAWQAPPGLGVWAVVSVVGGRPHPRVAMLFTPEAKWAGQGQGSSRGQSTPTPGVGGMEEGVHREMGLGGVREAYTRQGTVTGEGELGIPIRIRGVPPTEVRPDTIPVGWRGTSLRVLLVADHRPTSLPSSHTPTTRPLSLRCKTPAHPSHSSPRICVSACLYCHYNNYISTVYPLYIHCMLPLCIPTYIRRNS